MGIAILPTRRDLKFRLPAARITDWHRNGLHVTQFFNTLSLFFPVGERFFIDAVRRYRDEITDPALREAVTGFIGQEAMHGREHDELNDMLEAAGIPAKKQEEFVRALLELVAERTPRLVPLVATVALEHLTAILADILLRHPELIEGSEERFTALWRWHALEETEHKAVAFDVYTRVMGRTPSAYALRCFALVVSTSVFLALLYPFYVENVRRKGGLFDLRGWLGALNFQWGRPGGLRLAVKPWLDWFRPGFHPWDHDNREFLERLDEVLAIVESRAA